MTGHFPDQQLRLAAFAFLTEQKQLYPDSLPRTVLLRGFDFRGVRVPLMGPQGIFKPAIAELPLSITTTPPKPSSPAPYDDGKGPDGSWRYRYRGTNPQHPENAGLRRALELKVPLIYFFGIVPGKYMAAYPAFIIGDNPESLSFTIEFDDLDPVFMVDPNMSTLAAIEGRRQYITATVRQRMHQRSFRERVLQAYRESCAICRLRHQELLEAAHILPDTHPKGEPIVPNGLALCKLHHAAFDRHILGIRPDLKIEIRLDILEEEDGPMLKYGLQQFQGASLIIPRAQELRPNPDFLAERYSMFKAR